MIQTAESLSYMSRLPGWVITLKSALANSASECETEHKGILLVQTRESKALFNSRLAAVRVSWVIDGSACARSGGETLPVRADEAAARTMYVSDWFTARAVAISVDVPGIAETVSRSQGNCQRF